MLIVEALKDLEKVFIEDMDTYIQSEFERRPVTGFNETDKLNSRFTADSLPASFKQGNPNSKSKITINTNGIEYHLESNLKYAGVQEFGGFIESKGSMEWYFLNKWKETQFDFYGRIAKSLLKKRFAGKKVGVNIKARPYLQPALDNFDFEPIADRFIRYLNENN